MFKHLAGFTTGFTTLATLDPELKHGLILVLAGFLTTVSNIVVKKLEATIEKRRGKRQSKKSNNDGKQQL